MTADKPRIQRLKTEMQAAGIDALVCFKPEHTFYLSGFNPIIYSHPLIMVLPLNGDPVLLCHALRDDHARAETWVEDIRLYGAWSTKVTMGGNWLEALATVLGEHGLTDKTLGIEMAHMPIARYRQIEERLAEATLADSSKIFSRCRLIKDADEIAMARIAAKIADTGMDAAIEALAAGGNERDVVTASMAKMNSFWAAEFPDVEVSEFGTLEGGAQNGLWTWCLAGERMFMNCDNPTTKKPAQGEAVSIFIWAVANGYHAENERSVAVGKVSDAQRRAIDDVLETREAIKPVMAPGQPMAEMFHITKREFEARGYSANIPGRIGHTIGIGAHEDHSLDGKTKVILEPGMMFTLEPNLRVPGVASTQFSDTVLITEDGFEFLTKSRSGYIEV